MKNFKPNENFKYYMYFLEERMNIFWKRVEGQEPPYTEDPILRDHKFTNVYRSLDRVSQYLIREIINKDEGFTKEDLFFRILLFKHFNSVDTWELLKGEFGEIDYSVSFDEISKFLLSVQNKNKDFTPYSNAYMLTAAFLAGKKGRYVHLKGNGWKKYQYYFYIFNQEIFENGYMYEILESKSLEELYNKFLNVTSIAGFLAMQFSIDMNYSSLFNFDENDFIVAGLGAKRGIDKTFDFAGKPDYESVIYWVHWNFENILEKYGSEFKPLPGRKPKLIDLQNCFCETSKYFKGLHPSDKGGGKRIKNKFSKPKNNIQFIFPKKWGLNKI